VPASDAVICAAAGMLVLPLSAPVFASAAFIAQGVTPEELAALIREETNRHEVD
jgi:hypothetical protein